MRNVTLRILCTTALVLILAGTTQAQSFLTLKFGTLNPKDTKSGMIFGILSGRQIDERMDFGLSADLFVRKFTQESTVEEETTGQTEPTIVRREIDYAVWGLPIMAQLNVHLVPGAIVEPYIGIAGGYELLFSRERNYETDEKDSRFYHGFGWQFLIGGAYSLGMRSSIGAELFYNGATVKRRSGSDAAGFPLHEELDFSGLGVRIALRLGGL
jgi:hypothetical protein